MLNNDLYDKDDKVQYYRGKKTLFITEPIREMKKVCQK